MQNSHKISSPIYPLSKACEKWEALCGKLRTVEVAFSNKLAGNAKLTNAASE
jgi:hypothetical protein